MTVSRALRGDVRQKRAPTAALVRRIHEVAEQIGYKVDWKAKALRSGKTHLIGLLEVDPSESRWHASAVIEGLVDELQQSGFSLVLVRVGHGRDQLLDARFDGLLVDHFVHVDELKAIRKAGLPSVLINAPRRAGLPSVMLDHKAAGRIAGTLLADLGHRRIAYLRQSTRAQSTWPQHAYELWREGIEHALRATGDEFELIDMVPEAEVSGSMDDQANYWPIVEELFSVPSRPTAVVADCTKRSVEAVLANLGRLGLACPDDVSVLNMQDSEACGWLTPALTALEMPYELLGRAAAQRLLHLVGGEGPPPPPPDLAPRLVVRQSTGPAGVTPPQPDAAPR